MASCSFASFIADEDSCGQSLYYSTTAACVPLTECQKDVSQHLNSAKVFGDQNVDNEMKLLLARAGKQSC